MKQNIVQGLYIVSLRPNTNSRKNPGFHSHNPRHTLCHNYILRIYLKNYNIITPTLTSKDYETITMYYNYDN